MTALLPREPGRVLLDHLDRDLAARVPCSDDEHRPLSELSGAAVLAGVELDDARVELGRERRQPGNAVACHRNDHVLGLEDAIACLDHEAAAVPGHPSALTPVRTGSSNRAA